MEIGSPQNEIIVELIAALRLTPRQMQEMFRILGHIFETSKERNRKLLWGIQMGTIAMAAFKVGKPKIFNSLGSQSLDPREALQFLSDLNLIQVETWSLK